MANAWWTSTHHANEYRMIEYESLACSNSSHIAELEDAATRVIRSGWYVLGQEVSAFEAEFADYLGVKHCIGVAKGLDALILAIEALELPKASDVLVDLRHSTFWVPTRPG